MKQEKNMEQEKSNIINAFNMSEKITDKYSIFDEEYVMFRNEKIAEYYDEDRGIRDWGQRALKRATTEEEKEEIRKSVFERLDKLREEYKFVLELSRK